MDVLEYKRRKEEIEEQLNLKSRQIIQTEKYHKKTIKNKVPKKEIDAVRNSSNVIKFSRTIQTMNT